MRKIRLFDHLRHIGSSNFRFGSENRSSAKHNLAEHRLSYMLLLFLLLFLLLTHAFTSRITEKTHDYDEFAIMRSLLPPTQGRSVGFLPHEGGKETMKKVPQGEI